jgi:hypothetical protein
MYNIYCYFFHLHPRTSPQQREWAFAIKRLDAYGLQCRSFVSFWPVEFSSGRLGASPLYSDGDSGLADGKPDALPLQSCTQERPLCQLQTVTNHVHRDAFVHGRHQNYRICELLHLEKM